MHSVWRLCASCILCHQVQQASNRIMCMVRSFVLAGLLNRTLIVSLQSHRQEHTGIDRHVFLDIEHLRSCYGESAIITAKEYKVKYGEAPVVDAVMCWGTFSGACNINMKKFGKVYTDMGIGGHVRLDRERMHRGFNTRAAFMRAFGGVEAKTLIISNAFYALVDLVGRKKEWAWVYKKGVLPFPRLATCPSNIVPQPNTAIVRSAELLVQSKPELRARQYVAVHMRRGDFKSKFPDLRPVVRIAAYVKRVSIEWGLSTVVLLSDGSPSEVSDFKRTVSSPAPSKPLILVVTLPNDTHFSTSVLWFQPVANAGFHPNKIVFTTIQKLVAAQAKVFLGSKHSTFSWDIERLRYGFGLTDCRDGMLEQNEE